MKRIYQVLICMIVIIAGCKQKPYNQSQPGIASSLTYEKFKLTGLDGQPIDFNKYSGKTIFINFWATWCKPCVAEMPSLQSLTGKLKQENIVFLFASDEATEEIKEFKNSNSYSMEFVKAESLADLNIMGLPTTFIFDANGKLVFSEMGARQWDSEESIALIKQFVK